MAKQMNYIDQYGEVFPESYWNVAQVNINKSQKMGQALFYGYANIAQKGKRVIGQHSYPISPENYDKYFSPEEIQPEGIDQYKQAYILADETLDVSFEKEDPVSFFNNAKNV